VTVLHAPRATLAVAAKRALVDRLREQVPAGDNLEVHYAWPGNAGLRCVYGGGWRFDQDEAVAEPGLIMEETVAVSLYVRVLARPACDVEDTDADAEAVGGLLVNTFAANPQLAGGLTYLGIASGQGDYSRTDTETISIHAYQVRVRGFLVWGS